jgi:hypothetical protein
VDVVQEAARPVGRQGGRAAADGRGVLVQDILAAQEELQVGAAASRQLLEPSTAGAQRADHLP